MSLVRILNRLQQIRWDRGLSLEDVEQLTGVSVSEISRIENGKRNPKQKTMLLISKGLEIPVEDIFILNWKDAGL